MNNRGSAKMNTKMNKRRHTPKEIAAKLDQAEQLIAEGKLQSEVARALGVSIMTYHRWRKAKGHENPDAGMPAITGNYNFLMPPDRQQGVEDLRVENARLRNLFTDLILEKVKLEEELRSFRNAKK
jgi:putative transposase